MFKTISAALVAASVIAAPAMANTTVVKKVHTPAGKTIVLKKSVRDANNKMFGKHHHHHKHFHKHYR